MKSGITVEEAKQLKRHLEENILEEIRAFENQTMCSVEGINLIREQAVGVSPRVRSLSIECGL